MKKMLIAAISAIAVIASVVGCQVYDSQTNQTLYSGMNAMEEGATSFETYAKTFNEICVDLSNDADNTADLCDKIFDTFFSFDEFLTAVKSIVGEDSGFTGDVYNIDELKEFAKGNDGAKYQTDADSVQTIVRQGFNAGTDSSKIIMFPKIGAYSLNSLYQKEYKLKWDYNSKK
ncbi:MAG: hypothetical protein IKQ61_09800 [Spirochaetales bacterium]|nr:hypothetical protein [Spirochaetales bacterium]